MKPRDRYFVKEDVGDNIYGPSPKYSYPQNSLSINNIGNTLYPQMMTQPISNQRQLLANETTQQPFVTQRQNFCINRRICSDCNCFI